MVRPPLPAEGEQLRTFCSTVFLGDEWLRDGSLAHLRYHRAGAARSAVAMASYVDNPCCGAAPGAGEGTVDDMVARTERGLLLTCLWYIREVYPATLL